MRLYGKKLIRQSMRKEVAKKREIRNGIVWSVDTLSRTCRVKIQGSNIQIVAWYPENWEITPPWLKPGNPVTVVHQGNRGRIEVLGHGQVIPSPVDGGDPFPDIIIVGSDHIIEGMQVTHTGGNEFEINEGLVQFDGQILSFSGGSVNLDHIGTDPTIFRYDIIAIGSDLIIDLITGTDFTSEPSEPSIPSGHLKVAKILVQGGEDEQGNESPTYQINMEFTDPTPTTLEFWVENNELDWTQFGTSLMGVALDQYGNPVPPPGGSYTFVLSVQRGNGEIYSSMSGWSEEQVTMITAVGYSATFAYRRRHDETDNSPTLYLTMHPSFGGNFVNATVIRLLDEFGGVMWY